MKFDSVFVDDIALETERLILRHWREDDLEPFAALNADPEVMEYFPSILTFADTEDMLDRVTARIYKNGYGFWAAELKSTGEFIGMIGLSSPADELPFSPCVEVGWRLAKKFWGRGLAPEGARACLHYGFNKLCLSEIVSFTTQGNQKSRRVMEKIGMATRALDDFDHPRLVSEHPLARHVLYRKSPRG